MKHVLENIRVVEIGGYIVGSFCATLLADMGANVIKVESFSGDGLRGLAAAFQGYNRGKRGIAVNLRTDEGKKIVKQLINDSDVLVQNLRHGVTTQLQIDYKDVYEYNPGIIYLAMPGYGQSGPYVTKPAFDPLLQAMSGVMAAQGGRGAAPVYLRAAIGDYSGALLGAFGVAMALYNRALTGKGEFVHSSLLNATVAMQAAEFIKYADKKEEFRMGTQGKNAIYRIYRTKNNWIFIGCETEIHWNNLCRALGEERLFKNTCYISASARAKSALALYEQLSEIFIQKTTHQWVKILQQHNVPCSRVNSFRDIINHSQLTANNMITEHLTPDMGALKQRDMVVNLSLTPGKL